MEANESEINMLMARWRGLCGVVEFSDYSSVLRENLVILSRSVLFLTTFVLVFVVIMVFQLPVNIITIIDFSL